MGQNGQGRPTQIDDDPEPKEEQMQIDKGHTARDLIEMTLKHCTISTVQVLRQIVQCLKSVSISDSIGNTVL